MDFMVIVDSHPDDATKIGKWQPDFETREEADAHVAAVAGQYPNAFVVNNPPAFGMEYATIDMYAKTFSYDNARYVTDTKMVGWEREMLKLDVHVNRDLENLYDAMPLEQRDAVHDITKNKIVARKAHRALRP
jgi:hypothetical protein